MSRREQVPGYGQVWEGGGELQNLQDWPLPFPIPYRAIGYFAVCWVLMWVLRRVWALELTVDWIKPWIAYSVVPFAAAWVLTKLEPYGRSSSRHVWALVRHYVAVRDRCLDRPLRPVSTTTMIDGETAVAADRGMSELPYCVVEGPATVQARDPLVLRAGRRRTWVAGQAADDPDGRPVQLIRLQAGERLVVKP